MKLFNPSRRWDYVLLADRESPEPTVFKLRRLTWEEMGEYSAASPYSLEESAAIARIAKDAAADGRELTVEDRASIDTVAPMDQARVLGLMRAQAIAARRGTEAIRGLVDEEGKPLKLAELDRDQVEIFYRHAPPSVLVEIAMEVLRMSHLTEDDRKNSLAPPGPTA